MPHRVTAHDEFVTRLGQLEARAQVEVSAIWSELERDALFAPLGSGYGDCYTCKKVDEYGVVCRHNSDWGRLQMMWTYKYSLVLPSTIEEVTVYLTKTGDVMKLQPREEFLP